MKSADAGAGVPLLRGGVASMTGAVKAGAGSMLRWLQAPPAWLAWAIFALAVVNVFAFVLRASNPVLMSDGWYFLDVFIRHAIDGTLTVGDFFVKRAVFDHAQPLRKLILLIELRYFDLDMSVQAMFGVVCAAGSLLLFRRMADPDGGGLGGSRGWVWAAICLLLVSLNSSGEWTWPLVAGAFTSYIVLFALVLRGWQASESGRFWWLFVLALAFDVIADDTALIGNVAILLALGWAAWRRPALRPGILRSAATLLATLIVVRIGYHWIEPPLVGQVAPLDQRLQALWHAFAHGGWWQWITYPLASSIVSVVPLKKLAGQDATVVRVGIAAALVLCHAWFWWRACTRPASRSSFAAVALMLVFYALCAGIIVARVPVFGNTYLLQPRYVLMYCLGLVALLLMASSSMPAGGAGRAQAGPVLIAAVALAWLVFQGQLSWYSWRALPWISAYQQRMAEQIGQMARDPDVTPNHCAPELPPCQYTPEKRRDLIGLLEANRLNVFSWKFQHANRLYPYLQPAPNADPETSQPRQNP